MSIVEYDLQENYEARKKAWAEAARPLMLQFAKTNSIITPQELWSFVEGEIGAPPHPNMKGSLFKQVLLNENHVVKHGTVRSTHKAAKGRVGLSYQSMLCKHQFELVKTSDVLLAIQKEYRTKRISLMQALKKAYEHGKGVNTTLSTTK